MVDWEASLGIARVDGLRNTQVVGPAFAKKKARLRIARLALTDLAAQPSGPSRKNTSTAMSGSRWLSLMNATTLRPVSLSTLIFISSAIVR